MSDYTLEEALNATDDVAEELFVIDSDLRTIQGPQKYVLGVFNDQNVQTVHFKCPRHYNEIDLSTFSIKINYKNARNALDMSLAKNLQVSDDYITFDWATGKTVFTSAGNVTFNICLTKVDTNGDITNEFNTTIYSLKVLEGLEVTLSEAEESAAKDFLAYISEAKTHIDTVSETVTKNADIAKTSAESASESAQNASSSESAAKSAASEANTFANNAETSAINASNSENSTDKMKTQVESLVNDAKDLYEKTKAIAEDLNGLTGLSDLEKRICMDYLSRRTGEVFETRFYYHSVNQTSSGIKKIATGTVFKEFKDSTLSATPSTNLVDNPDDFLGYLPFQWDRCNYIRDDNTFARPIAMKGDLDYKETGSVDVGTIAPTFFWRITEYPNSDGTDNMYGIMISDSPHPELGLVPFAESIIPGKGYMPYYILSAFPSGVASDGLLRSQPNLVPAYNQSHNNMKTEYAKKGVGYTGSTAGRHAHWIIFNLIKYGTKNSQNAMVGCSNFNQQIHPAIAEGSVKRVVVASTIIYPGACVSLSKTELTSAPDRNTADCHTTCNRVRVKSVEDIAIDGNNYKAINLDISEPIDTKTDMWLSTMPCFTGETESIQGKKDGSYLSNTDGRHTLRIHGVEYAWGQYDVLSDQFMSYNLAENVWDVYTCKKGQKHTANPSDYKLIGKMPRGNDENYWIGDLGFDPETAGFFVKTVGSGSGTGVGDILYQNKDEHTDKSTREYLVTAVLGYGSLSGSGFVRCGSGLGGAGWYYGSCD